MMEGGKKGGKKRSQTCVAHHTSAIAIYKFDGSIDLFCNDRVQICKSVEFGEQEGGGKQRLDDLVG